MPLYVLSLAVCCPPSSWASNTWLCVTSACEEHCGQRDSCIILTVVTSSVARRVVYHVAEICSRFLSAEFVQLFGTVNDGYWVEKNPESWAWFTKYRTILCRGQSCLVCRCLLSESRCSCKTGRHNQQIPSLYLSLRTKCDTELNVQNVLNHVSDQLSDLTGKRWGKKFPAFGLWR